MSIKSQVKQKLTDHPALRDDRNKLIVEILASNYSLTFDQIEAIARLYKEAASIDRYWRQTQQQNPELRGKEYIRRHDVLEPHKLDELGYGFSQRQKDLLGITQ